MHVRWRKAEHRQAEFMSVNVKQTRLNIVAETSHGSVALRLRIAWSVPQYNFTQPETQLRELPTRNHCIDFSVKLSLLTPALLAVTTFDYFDGRDRSLSKNPNYAILHCASKWYRSANRVLNRTDTKKEIMDDIMDFMRRRMNNAFGNL